MTLTETGYKGLLIIEPRVYEDARGYFMETYNQTVFDQFRLSFNWVQDNQSRSEYGVIRGLHYQIPPYAQSKLVRVIEGTILDVAVDLRPEQPTFGKAFSLELSAANKKQLLIPKGFAHGFSVLSEKATVFYKCDSAYRPAAERSINPFDKTLSINWLIQENKCLCSEKDTSSPAFNPVDFNF